MKNYYSLFVELSLQQCTQSDYADKTKVKTHNVVSKKLKQLQDEMRHCYSKEVLAMLLNHEDDRVKVNAAAFCLQSDVMVEQAVIALNEVVNSSEDSTICFSAKQVLKHSRF